ncbi:MAG TPA: MMPL family transporter [Nocardioides sp.]|nr:MMPL family transporter [Nocardioides sp.]
MLHRVVSRPARLARLGTLHPWWVVAGWLVLAAVLNVAVPQLEEVAGRNASPIVPEDTPSVRTASAMDEAFGNGRSKSVLVVAMTRPGGLAPADRDYLVDVAAALRRLHGEVGFVQDVRRRPELVKALTSEDGEARYLLVGTTAPTGAPAAIEQVDDVRRVVDAHAPDGLEVEVTGPTATIADLAEETDRSVLRITIATVLLIGVILLLIYRSLLAAGLILAVVGVGLGIARPVVSACGLAGLFPVSTFGGSFMTAIVLGAGTDYAVFLLARYHEQRRLGLAPEDAAGVATARVASVVLGSGLTVVLATLCMAAAQMGFFTTTGPAIAVSIAVNLVVSLTLTPALLTIAGRRGLLEPRALVTGPGWERLAGLVAAAPARAVLVSLVPLLLLASLFPLMNLTYDTRSSQPDDTESNRGYTLLGKHFPINEVVPSWVLIQADHDLRDPGDLALLERAAGAVARQDGIDLVRSITRPDGHPIDQASVGYQAAVVGRRLGDAEDRLGDGVDGAQRLAGGADRLADGAGQLGSGADRLADGTGLAVAGADRLAAGTGRLASGMQRLLDGADRAASGSDRLAGGMRQLANGLDTAAANTRLAVDGLGAVLDALEHKSLTCGVDPACRQARAGLRDIWTAERDKLLPGLRQAADAARQLASGSGDLADGLDRLRDGIAQARQGVSTLRAGQQEFASKLGRLGDGAQQLADGAGRLAEGAGRIAGGTERVATSLPQLRKGLAQASRHLRHTGAVAKDPAIGGFYLPPAALQDRRFAAASGLYLSEDGRTARFMVLDSDDAFGDVAAARTATIARIVRQSFSETRLADADVSTTGIASTNHDLVDISADDLHFIEIGALVAVFLVLLLLLRSVVAALVLMGTVVLSYAAAMGLAVAVFQLLLGQEIDWTVEAVAFVILVAVGADYNLLLTKRMHEEAPDGDRSGVARATAATGGVITTAGLIFAGSMFALMAGRVSTMGQCGLTIGAGLLIDTFVVRTVLVPGLATLLGRHLWWPRRMQAPAAAREAG